jgi:hypothetical protein
MALRREVRTLLLSTMPQGRLEISQAALQEAETFLDTEPRPSPAHKLALLLPQNKATPMLVWMRIDTSHGFESMETDPILGPGKCGSFVVNHVPTSHAA